MDGDPTCSAGLGSSEQPAAAASGGSAGLGSGARPTAAASRATDFAQNLSRIRDQAPSELVFVIGGADGLAPVVLARADIQLSFGQMVWPHMLARVMLTEQLYRSVSILAWCTYQRV